VVATIVGRGDKDLVQITVDTDGATGSAEGVLIATDGHPFWVADLNQWVDATDLQIGQWLRTSAGTWAQITGIMHWTQGAQVHNLTVDDIHTYYVVAGTAAVLVHNCGPEPGPAPEGSTLEDYRQANLGPNAPRFVTEYTSPNGNRYYGRTTRGGVEIEPGSDLDSMLRGRHTGCSEVCALNEAQKAGDEILGGTYRTLQVNSGKAVKPCEDFCQPMIRRLVGIWY
jgi:hypothetical protein